MSAKLETYLEGEKALVDFSAFHSGDSVGAAGIGTPFVTRQIDEGELAKELVGTPSFED